jgi:hypothetical protein
MEKPHIPEDATEVRQEKPEGQEMTEVEKEALIRSCDKFIDLFNAVLKIGDFTSKTGHEYKAKEIAKTIVDVINGENGKTIEHVTRSFGIRAKLNEIMIKHPAYPDGL